MILKLLVSLAISNAPVLDTQSGGDTEANAPTLSGNGPDPLPEATAALSGVVAATAPGRAPVTLIEARHTPLSRQAAATLVETYYALIEGGLYPEAYRLWIDGGRGSGRSLARFTREVSRHRRDWVNVGRPGRFSGGAGSLYVEVPVTIRTRSGGDVRRQVVTLRRTNRVPASGPAAREWRIYRIRETGPLTRPT